MKVTAVDSGRAALATLTKAVSDGAPFQLIIPDCHMPEMDGFTLAERTKRNPELVGSTIMMLTSGAQQGDAARAANWALRRTSPSRSASPHCWNPF